jgi:hypothetical protein
MLQTEAVAATSQKVLQQVATTVGHNLTADSIRQHTVVTVPPNTQALQITYTSTDRRLAPTVADAIAKLYLAKRLSQADHQVNSQIRSLAGQLKSSRAALLKAVNSHDPSTPAIRAAVIDIQGRMATLNAQATQPGRVLTQGSLPSGSRTRHLAIYGVAGLIVGALLGLAAAVWRERKKDLVRSVDDLQDYELAAPVTTVPGPPLDEAAMRRLRMRLFSHIHGQESLALVGVAPGQSLRFGVLLGKSLAAGGKAVVLVDGTGTDPRHRDLLHVGNEPGLAEALIHDKVPAAIAVQDDFDYVPTGASAQEASEYFVDERAAKILHGIGENHDLALVACMPPDTIEGESLARLCGSVLLLVQLNRTSHFQLGMALRSFSNQGLRLSGVFVLPRRL